MCLAIPSKVTTIDGDMATIEVGGVTRAVSLMLLSDDVVLGDYVIVHAGFAIHNSIKSPENVRTVRVKKVRLPYWQADFFD